METSKKEMSEDLLYYGAGPVSSLHDRRYYDPEEVGKSGATPNTCPDSVREELISLYGEDRWWQEFWGDDYYDRFPEQKTLS